jgi:hypothetical protein
MMFRSSVDATAEGVALIDGTRRARHFDVDHHEHASNASLLFI